MEEKKKNAVSRKRMRRSSQNLSPSTGGDEHAPIVRHSAQRHIALGKRGKSAEQNFNELFFGRQDGLRKEFDELYRSLFLSPEPYEKIVALLGTKREGLDRGELLDLLGEGSGGCLSRQLDDLEECGFALLKQFCQKVA